MTIREELEKREHRILSPYATFSDETRGRDREEEPCDMRTAFARDRDRILHSKAFRRLKHKTQVFLAPEGDHYRTRLTHTLEVSQIARSISRALDLNEDLTEAIALGHDLGHTPFGHAGERSLNAICPLGFAHYEQSVRIVEVIEKGGKGLNLTWEGRDGMRNHRTSGNPSTPEGKVVRITDKIAYINHDTDDAIRAGILKESDIPPRLTKILGHSVQERLDVMIHALIAGSIGKREISMEEEIRVAMHEMRQFMFDHVYKNPLAKKEEEKVGPMLTALYEYYMKNPGQMPEEYQRIMAEGLGSRERVVCDYVSGMSDLYAISTFENLFVPKAWKY